MHRDPHCADPVSPHDHPAGKDRKSSSAPSGTERTCWRALEVSGTTTATEIDSSTPRRPVCNKKSDSTFTTENLSVCSVEISAPGHRYLFTWSARWCRRWSRACGLCVGTDAASGCCPAWKRPSVRRERRVYLSDLPPGLCPAGSGPAAPVSGDRSAPAPGLHGRRCGSLVPRPDGIAGVLRRPAPPT